MEGQGNCIGNNRLESKLKGLIAQYHLCRVVENWMRNPVLLHG